MSGEEEMNGPENANPVLGTAADEISKQSIRNKVWEHLERNRLVNFPRPVFGRIPNFKGAEKASARLLKLEEFRNANFVEVNPDKPLEVSRGLVIEKDKVLYVPVPQLHEGLLKKISFCQEDKPNNVRQTVTRWGIETLGKSVDLDDNLQVDLLVLGSVAVSKDGRRIGKGKGYADLEYAILKEIKAVSHDTTIVTVVHDSQVFDNLPKEIFEKHDVPLDYILTPTQIIKVEDKLPRPEGIYWDLLSHWDLDSIPILQKIRQMHLNEGRDVSLKEDDANAQDEDQQKSHKTKPRLRPSRITEQNGVSNSLNDQRPRRRRFFRRTVSNAKSTTNENEDSANKENEGRQLAQKKRRPSRRNGRRSQGNFSLVVSNIDRNVRVRHLKEALIDKGIKPNNITWRGYKGFCYLHYVKPAKGAAKEEEEEEEEDSFAVDNVIEILQTLKLNTESSNILSVKVMEPITRIETTDVTSV